MHPPLQDSVPTVAFTHNTSATRMVLPFYASATATLGNEIAAASCAIIAVLMTAAKTVDENALLGDALRWLDEWTSV